MAITLPSPPDKSAPGNNQNGPLQSADMRSFDGGVTLVMDGSASQNVTANLFLGLFFCATDSADFSRSYQSLIGESMSGPLSASQASGVVEAMDSVAPPPAVNLPLSLSGVYGGSLNYTVSEVTYNVTTYSVWVASQQNPGGEQRVGYIAVGVAEKPQIARTSEDLAGAFCPPIGYIKLGPEFGGNSLSWLTKPFAQASAPPEGGAAPLLTYGTVKVTSSAGLAGVARIKPGENATFLLPPGTYSAEDDVTLFGIPFTLGAGTYSSPPGAATAQFAVSLAGAESVWYGLFASVVIVIIIVLVVIAWKVRLWSLILRGSARLVHLLRLGWEALTRAASGSGPEQPRASHLRLGSAKGERHRGPPDRAGQTL